MTGDTIDANEAWRLGHGQPGRAPRRAGCGDARDGRQGRARAAGHRASGSRTRSTRPSSSWASATRGSTTSWPTTSPTTPPPRSASSPKRKQRTSMKEVFAARDDGDARDPPARRAAGHRRRHPHLGPVLRRPARRAGRRGDQGRAARHGRLHARDRPVRPVDGDDGPGYSLFWAVEGRGRKGVHPRPARAARARTCSAGWPRPPTWCARTSGPARWSAGTSAQPTSTARLVMVRITVFGQDGPSSQRPGLDRLGIGYGGLLHLTGYPDRPPVRPGRHRQRLPHRRVRRPRRDRRAVPARRTAARARAR